MFIYYKFNHPFHLFTKKRSVSSSSMRAAHNAERNTRSAQRENRIKAAYTKQHVQKNRTPRAMYGKHVYI